MSAVNTREKPSASGRFATTRWSLVLAAGDHEAPGARAALEALCAAYWYPLYAYARRMGCKRHQAQDLTQEFFARVLEKGYLQDVDRRKGKFRSFLLASFKHFLANERNRASAVKRGGRVAHFSIDVLAAESRYRHEPTDTATPERLYERQWALALLNQVLTRLRGEYEVEGNGRLFAVLKPVLSGQELGPYRETADLLGMTEGAVKVAVHRLRKRYRELLREEIGRTVADNGEVEAEIRSLFTALGPG